MSIQVVCFVLFILLTRGTPTEAINIDLFYRITRSTCVWLLFCRILLLFVVLSRNHQARESTVKCFSKNITTKQYNNKNGQITNGKRSTVKMLPGSVLLCPGQVPGLLGWAYPEQLGLSSIACGLMLGDSIRPCTNGVSLLHRIASVVPVSKPQTMF